MGEKLLWFLNSIVVSRHAVIGILFPIFWVDAKGYQLKWTSEISWAHMFMEQSKKRNSFPLSHCFLLYILVPLLFQLGSTQKERIWIQQQYLQGNVSRLISRQPEQGYSAGELGLKAAVVLWCGVQCGRAYLGMMLITSLPQRLWWDLWVQGKKDKGDNRIWERDKQVKMNKK